MLTLVIAGLIAMVLGALDQLARSLVIWLASVLVVTGEMLGGCRYRRPLYWSFLLFTAGVLVLWVMSAIGGIGGNTGRPAWWALILIPYPPGSLLGSLLASEQLRDDARTSDSPARTVGNCRMDE